WLEYLSRQDRDMDSYDILYYKIDLSVDFANEMIYGDNLIRLQVLEDQITSAEFDFTDNLTVDTIQLNEQALGYTHQDHQIVVELDCPYQTGDIIELNIQYHGHPVPPARYGWGFVFTEHNNIPIAFTMVEPYASRDWWPCKDIPGDKADSVDVWITCPSEYICAANGLLTAQIDNGDGTTTFQWHESYPIATYLVSIAITNYQIHPITYTYQDQEMEIINYILPEQWETSVELFDYTPEMIDFLSSVYCEYPFLQEKYGHAVYPGGGAMEHQTCTSFGSDLVNNFSTYTVLHELSHQWVGDLITCDSWAHIWLNEGFATYSEVLWSEYLGGDYYYHYHMNTLDLGSQIDDKLERNEGGPGGYILDIVVYYKGAWVLHMLRNIVGATTQEEIFHAYVQDPTLRYGTATTDDFTAVAENISGMELSWFFDQWFYNPGRPLYDYAIYQSPEADSLKITLSSTGSQGFPFDMYVPLSVNEEEQVLWVPDGISFFTICLDGELDSLFWDRDNWVLDGGFEEQLPLLFDNSQNRDATVQIFWDQYFDPGISGFNVYRSENGVDFSMINEFPVNGYHYIDENVENDNQYCYKITAVISTNCTYESGFSNTIMVSPVEFSFDEGILIVDRSYDYPDASPFPSDEDVDQFYSGLLAGYNFTCWDTFEEGMPPLSEMAKYSTIIWHNDDIMWSPFTNNLLNLRSYLIAGGNLLLTSWKQFSTIPENFSVEYLKLENPICNLEPDFSGGTGHLDFPDLPVDPDKVLPNWNGCLQFANCFELLPSGEVIYTFDSVSDDPLWENMICGMKYKDNYNVVLLAFPLYFCVYDDAQAFMDQVMTEFQENTATDDHIISSDVLNLHNYPNPFNPNTAISFQLDAESQASNVALNIFNIRGQCICTLFSGMLSGGRHTYVWEGTDDKGLPVSSGIYFYNLVVNERSFSGKMLLIK
ncbi:MAG: T9SS type A sorting domain-containing protein, partial [Candidatus Cloacimonetes bacterium]|nr:T9SS type A sorting domain-containing protein [Candidatus Cloacimonadota bacterium]